MSNIVKINKKSDLEELVKDKNALARLDAEKVEEFKTNFIELWNNKYLIQNADASELLNFCIQISNIGLSVNPWHKEVYILPFNVYKKNQDGSKTKVSTRLEAVYAKDGVRQMAYDNGFQIFCDTVWNINGKGKSINDLDFIDKSKVDFTNTKYVNENFLGFNFTLVDVIGNLQKQEYFVTFDYLKKVTKKLESEDHKIANYSHKAFRKAYNEFFIPKSRDTRYLLSKLDNINYNDDIETVQTTDTKQDTKKVENALKPSNIVKDVTVEDITYLYDNADTDIKIKMGAKLKGTGWNNYTPQQLNQLKIELEEIV